MVQLFGFWSSGSGATATRPKEALADPLPKCLCNVTKSLKEAVADPTWVQLVIATRLGMFGLFCSDDMV